MEEIVKLSFSGLTMPESHIRHMVYALEDANLHPRGYTLEYISIPKSEEEEGRHVMWRERVKLLRCYAKRRKEGKFLVGKKSY